MIHLFMNKKKTQSSIDSTFGIGARIDSQYIYIAYVKAITSRQLIRQFNKVRRKTCKYFYSGNPVIQE